MPQQGDDAADAARVLGIDAADTVGSAPLAAALAAHDAAAVGRALRHDIVVVPVTSAADGSVLDRDFRAATGRREAHVFSSTAALGAFLAGDARRRFVVERAPALRDSLLARHHVLDRVVFDAAGPHPMAASVDDVIDGLRPQPEDDEVAWAIAGGDGWVGGGASGGGGESDGAGRAGGRGAASDDVDPTLAAATALDIALGREWAVVPLDDARSANRRLSRLAVRGTRAAADARVSAADVDRWVREATERAAFGGCRFLAFRVVPAARGPSMQVGMHWFDLGVAPGPQSHLDRITQVLRAGPDDGSELAAGQVAAGALVRATHDVDAARDERGATVRLVVVDYWLAFSDGRGLCLLTFSGPQPHRRAAVRDAADRVVETAAWRAGRPISRTGA